MLTLYKKTDLELLIENLYMDKGILTPSDLSIKNISESFNFHIKYIEKVPSRALWDEEDAMIFLDPLLPEKKQRALFFHEIGHPLRHIGAQERMKSKLFMDLQESQANQFQLYAAIPTFMLDSIELPNNESYAIKAIEEIFNIPFSLAAKRMEQIKQRVLRQKIDIAIIEKEQNRYSKVVQDWSEETKTLLQQLENQLIQKKSKGVLTSV
ncbi:ImmA/IrrE family metallo-endopeptidase [Cytobacillus massiliigabonensis]|uniref:ImmA/IrrE family metallo-endopeptidase n=1 Tax=Cytobacillus massiliigabonensis TaxID=1871011 RepID=UPI000C83EFD3|nr:ImmA/IrrE family metallo-endopeptidase [Cytobacillus massiliigabonensis]